MTPPDDLVKRENDMITPELRAIYNKKHPTEDDLIAMATSEAERAMLSLPPHCHPTAGGLQHNEDHANACAHRCWAFLCELRRKRSEAHSTLAQAEARLGEPRMVRRMGDFGEEVVQSVPGVLPDGERVQCTECSGTTNSPSQFAWTCLDGRWRCEMHSKPPAPCATCGDVRFVCDAIKASFPWPCRNENHHGAAGNRRPCPDCSKPAPWATFQCDSADPPTLSANRYHQSLGAKWMCEAIARDLGIFGKRWERKWEDPSFWRPKTSDAANGAEHQSSRSDGPNETGAISAPVATQGIPQSEPEAPERCLYCLRYLTAEDRPCTCLDMTACRIRMAHQYEDKLSAAERRIAELEQANEERSILIEDINRSSKNARAEGREAGIREALDALRGRGEYVIEGILRALLAKKPEGT